MKFVLLIVIGSYSESYPIAVQKVSYESETECLMVRNHLQSVLEIELPNHKIITKCVGGE